VQERAYAEIPALSRVASDFAQGFEMPARSLEVPAEKRDFAVPRDDRAAPAYAAPAYAAPTAAPAPVRTRAPRGKWHGITLYRTLLTAVFLLFAFSMGYLVYYSMESSSAARENDNLSAIYQSGVTTPPPDANTPPDTSVLAPTTAPTTDPQDAAEITPAAVPADGDSADPAATPHPIDPLVNYRFAQLLELNTDVVGWITIPGTQTNNPVLQRKEDPDYYLTHDFYGQASRLGAIYAAGFNELGPGGETDANITLYGHHAAKGSMFGELKSYLDLAFYQKNPTFTFNTLYNDAEWAVFAVFVTSADTAGADFFEWRAASFTDEAAREAYLDACRARSVITTSVEVGPEDKLINLATCSYEFEDARLVVLARQVRPGESISTSDAAVNTAPTNPRAWYEQ
jgi:SrtB family sortase